MDRHLRYVLPLLVLGHGACTGSPRSPAQPVARPAGHAAGPSALLEQPAGRCAPDPTTGSLKARVAFADGTVPASFDALAFQRRAGLRSFDDCDSQSQDLAGDESGGALAFSGLPPGLYDLTISGPAFVSQRVGPRAVEAGGTTDLGTIVLDRGRTLRGHARRQDGAPLAGIKVFAAEDLWGDGAALFTFIPPGGPATTAADGSFTVVGHGSGPIYVVADDPAAGRSRAVRLPPGRGDVTSELVLLTTTGLEGHVTYRGQPATLEVRARPEGVGRNVTFALDSDARGHYRFDRLAPGPYVITGMLIKDGTHDLSFPAASTQVVLGSDGMQRLDLDVPRGATLTVHAVTPAGSAGSVTCVLFRGRTQPRTQAELDAAIDGLDEASARQNSADLGIDATSAAIVFEDVPPGAHTLCASVSRDADDAAQADARPVTCVPVSVRAADADQTVTLSLSH